MFKSWVRKGLVVGAMAFGALAMVPGAAQAGGHGYGSDTEINTEYCQTQIVNQDGGDSAGLINVLNGNNVAVPVDADALNGVGIGLGLIGLGGGTGVADFC